MIEEVDEKIVDLDITQEMETSFLEYAYSVIYARALPDARDGLKPVQRRILYQMNQMNLYPDRPYVKSARVVGDVMGKLHPHGDSAIYDTMVRLAQSFSLRLPLIDGHGNFGSPDDGPAAARYTEARMSDAALLMNNDIDEDTVDFVPNYDNKLLQPDVLPSAFPNLLVNGGMGIAVGMATNLAPHNLREVVKAAIYLIRHRECSLDDLMKFIPGPDFPTGGRIIGLEPIREAYETGRGTIKMRAKATVEKVTNKKQGIVVTELPYGVGVERVKEKLSEAVKNRKIEGISAFNDYTDRKNGLKLVIEVKNGFNPEAILNRLYKLTPLEENFGINSVALVEGTPKTLGLKEMIEVWVDHRLEVLRRRTEYRLKSKEDRLHLVDGLLIAILDIDKVIKIIRESDDSAAASNQLQTEFKLSEIQSNYILDLRLRRLTKFSRIELETEQSELKKAIEELKHILSSKTALEDLAIEEMNVVAKNFGDDRRTGLVDDSGVVQSSANIGTSNVNITGAFDFSSIKKTTNAEPVSLDLEIPDDPCFVILTATGMIYRQKEEPLSDREREKHDAISVIIKTTNRGNIATLTTHANALLTSVLEIPENSPIPLHVLHTDLAPGETLLTIFHLNSEKDDLEKAPVLALGTTFGVVKRVKAELPPQDRSGNIHSKWSVMSLAPGDSIVGAQMCDDNGEIVFIATDSSLLHYRASLVRPQGSSGSGMSGISLSEGQSVIFFGVISVEELTGDPEPIVFTVAGDGNAIAGTENGFGKLTPFKLYPSKGRATGGVRSQKFLKGQNTLIYAFAGSGKARANTTTGAIADLPPVDMRRDGSGTRLDHAITAVG